MKRKAQTKLVAVARRKAAAAAVKKGTPAVLKGISAVAINLERRPDRWLKIQRSVSRQAPWLPMKRLNAVDGRAAPPSTKEVSRTWSTANLATLFHWYKAVTVKMSPGERGCCGSHIAAWKLAAKSKKPLLVLEDDAVALGSFTPTLTQAVAEAPKDTGMIFLSSKDRGYPKRVGKVLMEPDFVWTTVGYLIYPSAARTLLGMLPLDAPVDNFLAWHIKEGAVKAFSVRPAAVRQAQTWNVGSDVPHSDDVAH
jgi:GR25 family glycosyltransferase involved in LPS biosynthesis